MTTAAAVEKSPAEILQAEYDLANHVEGLYCILLLLACIPAVLLWGNGTIIENIKHVMVIVILSTCVIAEISFVTSVHFHVLKG